jgi:hypothetical protein
LKWRARPQCLRRRRDFVLQMNNTMVCGCGFGGCAGVVGMGRWVLQCLTVSFITLQGPYRARVLQYRTGSFSTLQGHSLPYRLLHYFTGSFCTLQDLQYLTWSFRTLQDPSVPWPYRVLQHLTGSFSTLALQGSSLPYRVLQYLGLTGFFTTLQGPSEPWPNRVLHYLTGPGPSVPYKVFQYLTAWSGRIRWGLEWWWHPTKAGLWITPILLSSVAIDNY